ncbi:MAG: hypothetical protein HQ508_06030 [Candidatus Marinimicrobia bacterium]|nr:hypothetical protein [Candidatus Neomarinimicrobiota bacterium]
MMKKLVLLFLTFASILVFAQEVPSEYVGSKKCKICHSKAEVGSQYGLWEKGPHAKSLETLKTDAAKAIAKKMGLKEAPENSDACLKCHVTGWGDPSGYQLTVDPLDKRAVTTNENLASVGCESCHGAGSLYKSKKDMVAIGDGSVKGETLGLVAIKAETCTVCHNAKSPTYKPFVYADRVKEIAHPAPGK